MLVLVLVAELLSALVKVSESVSESVLVLPSEGESA